MFEGLRPRAIALALMLVIASGCGGETVVSDAGGADAASSGDTPSVDPAVVSTISGGKFDLGSLEGQDTVLWFWAPW